MDIRKHFYSFIAGVVVAGGSFPIAAQAALDAELMKLYGGTYFSDCTYTRSPRVTVFEEGLVVVKGNRSMTSNNMQVAHAYYGKNAPPDYQVALLSDVSGLALTGIVYRDAQGQYLMLDGDPKVRTSLGQTMLGFKFRLCSSGKSKDAKSKQ